jgi:DnaJ-class molecular chaperone
MLIPGYRVECPTCDSDGEIVSSDCEGFPFIIVCPACDGSGTVWIPPIEVEDIDF